MMMKLGPYILDPWFLKAKFCFICFTFRPVSLMVLVLLYFTDPNRSQIQIVLLLRKHC